LLVQVNNPPAGTLVKFVAATGFELQKVISVGTATVGVGFTVMMYVDVLPAQLLFDGVTVMVAVIGDDPGLIAVKAGTLPVPPAPRPMAVLEFVHEKEAPAGLLVKLVAATVPLLQTEKSAGTFAVGIA
jgi:hypothetical protein